MSDKMNRNYLEEWKRSRSGAWAARGFHYQHLLSTLILIRQWGGLTPSGFLIPEGFEDCVIELADQDIWLQVKSRESDTFSGTEVQRFLADLDAKATAVKLSKRIRTAIVLEKPCPGISEQGLDLVHENTPKTTFCCEAPGDESVTLLSSKLAVAEIIAEGIVSDLYKLVAEASQANASLQFEKRRRISTTEVERRIFERLAAEDPTAIDDALASGALEPVDFITPVSEPGFYQGVKVKPGHVAAGLVLDRPNDTKTIVHAIRRQRHVLVSGPSGGGKSALMWLAANVLAGEYRWYQITGRAAVADTDAIIRFLRSRRATEKSPIGLAFDEVGTSNSDLWNVLIRELRGLSAVYLLGSVRQEDVALIANQSDTACIPMGLDERLAEAVWQKLYDDKQTSWNHWREPFEQSEGLMLEYVHMLTQGKQLAAVIDEQVRQRQRENRHDELAIIRSTAVLCSCGGEVQASKLFELLDMDPDVASRALTRLIDEHLVRESRPGVLGGLHMLRSQALSNASHNETVFLTADSLWQSLPAATNETLPRVIRTILAEPRDEYDALVLRKLAEALGSTRDIDTWVAILTGLGQATLERRVDSFILIFQQHGVPRAQWSLASMFADPDIDIPELTEFEQWQKLRNAILAFRALPIHDLRSACLDQLPEVSVALSCQNVEQFNKLLSCVAPICGGEPSRLPLTADFIGDGEQNIREVEALLSTAYLVGKDMAEYLAQALGGEQVLFDWFRSQTPWVTAPQVDFNGPHGRTVRSDWFYVAELDQPDPHETICNICEALIALSPTADAAASAAVNPQGQPIAVGDFAPWSKNIPRRNIPAKTRVAWNVAFRQILLARTSSDSLTEYTGQMTVLVKRTEKVLRSFTEKWIRGKSISNADLLADEIKQIVDAVNALAYATPETPTSVMVTPAEGAGNDDSLGALLTGVLGNLVVRLNKIPGEEKAKGAAIFAGSLAAQAKQHEQSAIWRTTSEPPLRELAALAERLKDIASVLHEMGHDDGRSSIQRIVRVARKSDLHKAIPAAARHCNFLANRRFRKRLSTLENALKKKGWNARCRSRQIDEDDSVYWPAMDVAILVEITDFETDAGYIEDSLAMGQLILGSDWEFRVVPVLNGQVVASLALLPSSDIPLPDKDFSRQWREHIAYPFSSSRAEDSFNEAISACTQLSAIIACRDLDNLHPEEGTVFTKSIESFERNCNFFTEVAEDTDSEHFALAHEYLNQIWDQIVSEFEAAKVGQTTAKPFWMTSFSAAAGQEDDYAAELAIARLFVLQAECSNSARSGSD